MWQLWMGCWAALGIVCGLMLWSLQGTSPAGALAAGIGIALCAPTALVVISFIIAVASRDWPLSAGDLGYILRAFFTEVIEFNRAVVAMMSSAPPVNAPPGRVIHRPVLLIHGFACNHGVWNCWLAHLENAGFGPVRVVDLEPPFADLSHHAAHVEREVRALFEDSAGSPVDIISHSMGGLVARAVLQRVGSEMIGEIVTIGTPHHGTRLARFIPRGRSLQQLGPDSALLNDLNSEEARGAGVPITSIYSLEDNLVVPAQSSILRHAQRIELRGIGHLGLLSSRAAIDHALRTLAAQ